MNTGVHVGIGQGYEAALEYTKKLGCTTVQIFTHSPRMFKFKELDPERQQVLLDGWKESGINPVVSHASYLINIGASDNKKFYGALSILKKELEYAKAFGCQYVVFHVGKHLDATKEEGMQQVVKGITKLQETLEKTGMILLLETAAGQGTEFGRTFEEVAEIIAELSENVRKHIGVCLDTCHIFAAGYDLQDADAVVQQIEQTFGLDNLKVMHVNDSKFGLGEHKDRHDHLGQGKIGLEHLKKFLTHPKIRNLPMILETPIDENGDQASDLEVLNGFFA